MLEVGVKAPDFELPDQNGKIHRLSDYTGKKVAVYKGQVQSDSQTSEWYSYFENDVLVIKIIIKSKFF